MKKSYQILLISCAIFFFLSEFLLIKGYINQRMDIKNYQEKYERLKNDHKRALLRENFQGIDVPLKEDINEKTANKLFRKEFSLIIYFSLDDCETCISEKLISLSRWQHILQRYNCKVLGVTGIDSLNFLPNLRDAFNIQFPIYQIVEFEEKMGTFQGLLTPFVFFAYGKNLKSIYLFNSQISGESFQEFLIKIKNIIN